MLTNIFGALKFQVIKVIDFSKNMCIQCIKNVLENEILIFVKNIFFMSNANLYLNDTCYKMHK